MSQLVTDALLHEYEQIVSGADPVVDDDEIISRLIRDGAWTEDGACEVLELARRYGTSILRNALALACALDIEDGSAGL